MTTMNNLPEELLINILLRFPVKSLLRFKSVSKLWLSLISDPHFANSHFQRSSFFPHRLLHIAHSQARSVDFNSSFYHDSAEVQLNCPITSHPRNLRIWGSCRGFVLLNDDHHNFSVWNPSTSSYKRLPCFPMPSQFSPFICGFGYDASNDDYLLVLAAHNPSDVNFPSVLGFFSLKANSWEKIDHDTHFPYLPAVYKIRPGLFLNGAIHWLAYRRDITYVEVIIAFNVTERNFMEIPLADDLNGLLETSFFVTLGECLSLCVLENDTANIWLMKEYGMKSSWTKSIVVSLIDIPLDLFFPICITEDGEIVGIDGSARLVKCNDKGEVIEYRSYIDKSFEAITYTETLLSLLCDSGKVREEDEQH